jgi:hypothetical protein
MIYSMNAVGSTAVLLLNGQRAARGDDFLFGFRLFSFLSFIVIR